MTVGEAMGCSGSLGGITSPRAGVQVGVALPECGSIGLAETAEGSIKPELDRISSYLDAADTILVGPGLDDLDLARQLLAALLEREALGGSRADGETEARGGRAVVLDAYALGALAPLEDRRWRRG